jgi:hypothetical protein
VTPLQPNLTAHDALRFVEAMLPRPAHAGTDAVS